MKTLPRTAFALGLIATPVAFALTPPPTTPASDTVEFMHGEKIADPYRWLEGGAAPELKRPDPALDARVRAWDEAQNTRTREYLDAIPGREALTSRLRELLKTDSLGAPVKRGGREFYSRRTGTASNAVFLVRENGVERTLLDIDKLFPDGRTTLAETAVSHDGKRVAFALYRSGDENTSIRILNTDTGAWLPDALVNKAGGVSWLPGGDAFIYHRKADIKNPYSTEIRLHRIGEAPEKDRLIFEQYKTGPLATTYGPSASLDRSGRFLTLIYHTGTAENDLWVCDFEKWLRTGELVRTDISVGRNCINRGAILNGILYLNTTEGSSGGRLFRINLARPSRPDWKEIASSTPESTISGFSLAKDRIALIRAENALRRIELLDLDGTHVRDLKPPGIGTIGLATDEESDEAYLAYSSFNTPPTTYRVDLITDSREVYFRPDIPVNPDDYVVRQLFCRSKDGTRVPLFIAHRKGLKLDGTNPTILYGYGGFGAGQKPGFIATMLPWLDAGGVFVLAGLRGGDEYGEPWHKAGMLGNKQNVFDDFIASAEFLIAEKYTSPGHLGARGGSNGGLLTGAALTQRPDLFAAVNVAVPLLDMLRYQHFLMAKYWIPEYGDPARAPDFSWLRAYSPYHRVRAGAKYPATLLEAGAKDARVHPLHARKMAAALQAATAGDPEKSPILLRVDFDSGHGMGKSFDMRLRDTTDMLLFFAKNLGLRAPGSSVANTPTASADGPHS